MEQKKKKGLVAGIAAVVTVALAFIMFSPTAAGERFDAANAPSIVMLHREGDFVLDEHADNDADETKKKRSGFSIAARWIARALKTALVSLCLGAVSFVIKLLGALAGTAGGGVGAVLGFLLGDLLPVLFLLLLVFCFLFKLIFPDIELKRFLCPKNVLILTAGSFVISAFMRFSAEQIENRVLAGELNLVVSVVVIFLLWLIIFSDEFKTSAGSVRLLREPRTYILLVFLVGVTVLVGRAEASLLRSAADFALLTKLLDCAWFCFLLISVAAYIFRHTGSRHFRLRKV